ncbi:MAG: enoyl-CoA hydratase-related protein [Chloroflexi bacterium]|nr:enoyl-CoA hydratase-related protein [Chloroflexota bacterium]
MAYENLLVEREEGVGIITINRPHVLNALSRGTLMDLDAAIDELNGDPEVRAIIITGAGEKAFVAGADINELRALASGNQGRTFALFGQSVFSKIENLPKPVIMAVNGFALGGGCELAISGDIRIASENAQFGQPEINLGIIAGYGGSQRLPRLVGVGMAKLLLLSGDRISAQEALRIGLADKVVPAAELMATAKDLAKRLASKSPLGLALAKECVNKALSTDISTGLAFEATQFGLAAASEDRVEGTSAFLEKRKPVFKGK